MHGVHSHSYAGSPSPLPSPDDSPDAASPDTVNVPGEHGLGSVEPVAQDEPAGQPVHSEALVSFAALE